MRTAIVIPARLGATRLPRKPLAPLGGMPLVARTARQAQKCQHGGHVIVATDSAEIAAALAPFGLHTELTRADHASGTDRVAEVTERLGLERVVNLQGDEPFIDPRDLDALFDALERGPLATLSAPIDERGELDNPNVVKVVTRDDGRALYFSRAPIPYERAQTGAVALVRRHVGVYAYHRDALLRLSAAPPHPLEQREALEQLRALALGMDILVLPSLGRDIGISIDTAEDLRAAQERVEELGEAAFP